MSTAYIVLSVLLTLCTGLNAQWAYTTPASTTDGRPCFTDCINNNCIVDWLGNRLSCVTENFGQAYRYRTTYGGYCLSNCGYFGYEYEWCVTSNDKKWAFCNSGDRNDETAYKRRCKEHCDKYGAEYNWCYVDGGSWEYCAPPREKQNRQ